MKRIVALVLLTLATLVFGAPALATNAEPDHKVTLCHRTNSDTNPYVQITVDVAAGGLKQGHETHNGPVWEPGLKEQGTKWGDIIPAYEVEVKKGKDTVTVSYPGKNLTPEGLAILNGACEVVTPTPTPIETPTTPEPSETPTTPEPSETPTTPEPSESETPSGSPTPEPSNDKPDEPNNPEPNNEGPGKDDELPATGGEILILLASGLALTIMGYAVKKFS